MTRRLFRFIFIPLLLLAFSSGCSDGGSAISSDAAVDLVSPDAASMDLAGLDMAQDQEAPDVLIPDQLVPDLLPPDAY